MNNDDAQLLGKQTSTYEEDNYVCYTMYIGTFSATSVQQFCPIRGQGDLFANTHELDLQILPNEACFLLCIGGSLELIRFSDILLC